jgi:uncharacterized protein YqeY
VKDIRALLKADLRAARNAGDAERVSVARTLLAAIANAEAVELDASHPQEVQGWAEVPRRRLTAADLAGILRREADELRAAADDFARRGARAEAERLRARARLVDGYRGELP